jgi:predicted RNase H-like nuclease (RuvC/YqgF family)
LKISEKYESEISSLNKEVNKFKTEVIPNQQRELDLRTDEIGRLRRELAELDSASTSSEQKIDTQVKRNQRMKDKLVQLQTEINSLINGGAAARQQTTLNSSGNSEAATYESIIENLKFIIQEQLALRNTNSQNDLTELKFKVRDLSQFKYFS